MTDGTLPDEPQTNTLQNVEKTEVGARIKALRKALKMTHDQVAAATEKLTQPLLRSDISRVETGRNEAKTDKWRVGLATAFGLTRDGLADYLDGKTDLQQCMTRRQTWGSANLTASLTATGELSPPHYGIELDDEFPNRATAIAWMKTQPNPSHPELLAQAIVEVRQYRLQHSSDPSVDEWIEKIRQCYRDLQSPFAKPPGQPISDPDV